jgi:hypothetical protein
MLNEPAPYLLRYNCLTRHRYFGCPFSVDPDPKTPTFQKRKINQFHFEAVSGKMIFSEHAVVRFGTRHSPLYRFNHLVAKDMLLPSMHGQILSRVYRARLIP